MKNVVILLMVCLFCTALTCDSIAVELGLITGKEKCTDYQVGLDMQQLVRQFDFQLNVFPSEGSIENVYAIYKRPGIPMGIVQADVLAFVAKTQTNPVLKAVAKKVKLVFPLYNCEVHVLARKGISSFEDLVDKRVAIGDKESGSFLTSKLLFEVAQVNPREMLNIGNEEALAQLKSGAIDAMIHVDGAPVKLFQENVTDTDNLQLIPITDKSILEYYPSTAVPANTYSWQKNAVPTVEVKTLLVSFDFRTEQCDNIGRFAQVLSQNISWLKENGHPKWKQVDLQYTVKGLDQYDCVRRYLTTARKAKDRTRLNPVLDAIRETLH